MHAAAGVLQCSSGDAGGVLAAGHRGRQLSGGRAGGRGGCPAARIRAPARAPTRHARCHAPLRHPPQGHARCAVGGDAASHCTFSEDVQPSMPATTRLPVLCAHHSFFKMEVKIFGSQGAEEKIQQSACLSIIILNLSYLQILQILDLDDCDCCRRRSTRHRHSREPGSPAAAVRGAAFCHQRRQRLALPQQLLALC